MRPASSTASSTPGALPGIGFRVSPPRVRRVGNLRRTVASLVATMAIVGTGLLGAGLGINSTIGILRGRPLGLLDWLAVAAVTAMLVLARQLRQQQRPLRRVWILPVGLQRRSRRLVELSLFGTGPARQWTTTDPSLGLERIVIPGPPVDEPAEEQSDSDPGLRSRELPVQRNRRPTVRPRRQQSSEVAGPAPADEASDQLLAELRQGPTTIHRVTRGDTYWSLAERYLGDGRQWAALRDLNQGREVAPGTTLTEGEALRRGWELLVPANRQTTRETRDGQKNGSKPGR